MNVVKGRITPLHDKVMVTDMHFGAQTTKSGIFIASDDGKSEGVRPRWGKVWAVGPEQHDVKIGDWIYVEHGRWTRGITVEDENGNEVIIRMVDNKAIMLVSDENPGEAGFGIETHRVENNFDFSSPSF